VYVYTLYLYIYVTWSRLPSIEAARRPSEDGTKEDDDDDEKENV
jgi:hypothetical protein